MYMYMYLLYMRGKLGHTLHLLQVFFIESICDDPEIIHENIKVHVVTCHQFMQHCVVHTCTLHVHAASTHAGVVF